MRDRKHLRKFSTWECCVCAPLKLFPSVKHSGQAAMPGGHTGRIISSVCLPLPHTPPSDLIRATQVCLKKECNLSTVVIQQLVLVWSYFPLFPLGFFLSLFPTNGKVRYAWNAKFWSPLTVIQFPVQQNTPETWFQPGAALFSYATGCASTYLPKQVFFFPWFLVFFFL